MAAYNLFTLTALTGRRNAQNRRVIFAGFEVAWSLIKALLWVIPPALVAGIVSVMITQNVGLFLLTFLLSLTLGVWLVESRSRRGLKLRRYREYLDQSKARKHDNKFYVAGRQVQVSNIPFARAWVSAQPVQPAGGRGAKTVVGGSPQFTVFDADTTPETVEKVRRERSPKTASARRGPGIKPKQRTGTNGTFHASDLFGK